MIVGFWDNNSRLVESEPFDRSGHARITKMSPICCRYSKYLNPFMSWIFVIIMLFNLTNCVAAAAAPAVSASLSFFALNTNGFVHPMKIDATNRSISNRNPDIIVITKTKTNTTRSSKMSYSEYQFF